MRIGFNPNKDKKIEPSDFFHQVIIPVHIPNFDGYFKDSFQILQYCLKSLFKTSHAKTYITVVNNGSCEEVIVYLNQLQQEGKIQEVIHTTAIGKLNAILKGLTGHQFQLITISDADVLFLNNWQKGTYDVFEAFPKAGVVSPFPNPKLLRHNTTNIIAATLFSKQVNFTPVVAKDGMKAFAKSIGNDSLFKDIHFEKQLTIRNGNETALLGAGHFVATYKGIGFNTLKQRFSKYSLGGDSEKIILDEPATDLGLWRLSTQQNYVFHLGNVKEDWMFEEFEKIDNDSSTFQLNINDKVYSGFLNDFYMKILSRIIFKNPFWQFYLRLKGLTKEQAKQY